VDEIVDARGCLLAHRARHRVSRPACFELDRHPVGVEHRQLLDAPLPVPELPQERVAVQDKVRHARSDQVRLSDGRRRRQEERRQPAAIHAGTTVLTAPVRDQGDGGDRVGEDADAGEDVSNLQSPLRGKLRGVGDNLTGAAKLSAQGGRAPRRDGGKTSSPLLVG
jgi:hypothetical protein